MVKLVLNVIQNGEIRGEAMRGQGIALCPIGPGNQRRAVMPPAFKPMLAFAP